MGLPKGFRKNISFIKQNIGPEKRQDYLDDIDYKGMYLPKSVEYEDIDGNFINFVKDDLKLNINGELIPVIFLTIQRWAEFSKTWELTDNRKNIKMPFITIVRNPDIQVGTNQAGNWNIPGKKLYTYIKVPSFVDGRKGYDMYKIPQPTSVDLTYEVKLFCNRMKDLNSFHTIIQKTFQSRQFYIDVKGHPMPIHFEKNSDDSQISDFNKRRFYVQNFEMKVLGYILDAEDFECVPAINRASLKFKEITGKSIAKDKIKYTVEVFDKTSTYRFNFKPNSLLEFEFRSDSSVDFNTISDVINTTNIIIKVNGVEVHNGLALSSILEINVGDLVTITITTNNINASSLFKLNGELDIT